ncbi:flippase [Chlamydiota bacterium]
MKAIDHIKVAKNLIFSALCEGSSILLFFIMIFAARFLGDADFGRYSFALAFVALFQVLADWGLSYASTIEIARDPAKGKEYLGNILGFQLISCILISILIILISQFMNIPSLTRTIIYLQVCIMILRSYKITFRMLFKAYERFDLEALTLFFERGSILIISFFVLYTGHGLIPFVLVFLGVRIIDLILTITLSQKKVISAIPQFNFGLWKDLFKKGFPFVLSYTLIFIFFQIDTVMLGLMRTVQEVGWYNAPFRIIEGLLVIPAIISYALLPTLSQAHTFSKDAVISLYKRGSKYLLLLALPLIVTCIIGAGKIIPLIFGSEYMPSIRIFQLLMPALLFLFLSNLGFTVISCINRQKIVITRALVCVGINITLNALLIPRYGAQGAALATCITEAIFFMFFALYLAKHGYGFRWSPVSIKPVLLTILLGIIQFFVRDLSLILFLFISFLVIGLLLFLLDILDEREKQVILHFFRKIVKSEG